MKKKVPAWEKAVEKALKKPRPPQGWPKPTPRRKKKADPLDALLRRELKKGPPGPYLPKK